MNRFPSARGAAALLGAAVLSAGLVLIAPPAQAAEVAPPGTLSLVPAKGTLDTPMNVVTSTMCPAGDYFTVAVIGKKLSKGGDNITGATPVEALLPYGDNQMNIPLSSTWRDFSADNAGGALAGTYTIEVRCRTALEFTPLARFVGTVALTSKGFSAVGSTALPPEKQKPAPAQPGASASAPAAPAPSASAPAASQQPAPVASAPAAAPGAEQPSQPVAEPVAESSSGGFPWQWLAIAGGVGMLALAIWSGRRRRDDPAPVAWDDDAPAAADAPDGTAGTEAPASPSTV